MDKTRLDQIIQKARGRGIAVVGDLMLDRYIWGKASRISQEAPVPVVAVDRVTSAPGGAANVLRNLAGLGARPVPFGVLGDDDAGRELIEHLNAFCPDVSGLQYEPAYQTTEKTRVLAGNQQVVRIDRDVAAPLTDAMVSRMLENLRAGCATGAVEAILVEDYAKGCITKAVLEAVAALGQEFNLPVTMDPHPANALGVKGLTLLTPNRAEAFALSGAYYSDGPADINEDSALQDVVRTLHERWAPEHLLVTLGARGMALYHQGEPLLHIPTRAQEVFDVSGAGDTVIAAFTVALLGGATPEEAAEMANHAAGVVVGKVGTAPIALDELQASFDGDMP